MRQPTHPACRTGRVVLAWGISAGLLVASPAVAAAAPDPFPSAEQVASAAQAASQGAARAAAIDADLAASRLVLDRAADQAGAAAEAHNGAKVDLEQRTAEAQAALAAAATAAQASEAATLTLSRYAAEVFQGGGNISQLDVFFGSTPQEALDRASGLEAVGDERARIMREADAARQISRTLQEAAAEAQARQEAAAAEAQRAAAAAQARADEAAAAAASLQTRQEQAVTELAGLRQTSVVLERDRQAGLAAQEQARREAENRRRAEEARRAAEKAAADAAAAVAAAAASAAAAQAAAPAAAPRPTPTPRPTTPRPATPAPAPSSPSPPSPGPAPSPSAGAGAVVAYARAQLGEPYVWAGDGPDTWDCSGLTMMAWRQAGVSLSHHSGTQYRETSHVALSAAQPGDLVFFGASASSIYHVGLYIGGGQMIHAPRPGDVVKVSSIYYMGDLLSYVGRP